MKVVDLKKLPKEFDFESNINSFGIVYHAIETAYGYNIACNINNALRTIDSFSKIEMRKRLFNNDFRVI